jgi:hypothetical protein
VFDNQYNGKKKLNWYFSYWIWEKCMFPNGAFDSRCAIYGGKHIGLVISPLKSLMIDQCKQTTHK